MGQEMTPFQIYIFRLRHVNYISNVSAFATFEINHGKRNKVVRDEDYRGLILWRPVRVEEKPDWDAIEKELGLAAPQTLRNFLTEAYFLEIDGNWDGWHCWFHPYDGSLNIKSYLKLHKYEDKYVELGYCSKEKKFGLMLFDTETEQCVCKQPDGICFEGSNIIGNKNTTPKRIGGDIIRIGTLNEILENLTPVKKIRYIEITDGSGCSGFIPNI